jgi:hypothetical protein
VYDANVVRFGKPMRIGVNALVAVFACLSCMSATAEAQAEPVPRFSIGSPQELKIALGGADAYGLAFPRAAIVALEGRRVLPWLLDLLRDETVFEPTRWAALRVPPAPPPSHRFPETGRCCWAP